MAYLEFAEFNKRFPRGKVIGCGTYSTVFLSENRHVVKEHANRDFEDCFFRELDIYSRLRHPCIFQITAWSYNFRTRRGLIALPLGMSLRGAYERGLITIERIMSDLISAITYLHSQDIAHLDIKPDNLIFFTEDENSDGRVVLIDFGLSQNAMLRAGRLCVRGIGFADLFRHPDYNSEKWNPVETDFYAAAQTLACVLTRKKYICQFRPKTESETINRLIMESSETYLKLKSSSEFAKMIPDDNILFGEESKKWTDLSQVPDELFDQITKIKTKYPIESRTLYLTLDLLERSKSYCQMSLIAGLVLASAVHGNFHKVYDLIEKNDQNALITKIIHILSQVNGRILTYYVNVN